MSDVLLPTISELSFHRKMEKFGLNHLNYRELLPKFPRVRIYDSEGKKEFAYAWCESNIHDEWIWSDPVNTNYTDIIFKNEDDALFFKLSF